MTRSVFDAAVALDAVTGSDPADPVTAAQEGKVPASYTEFLDVDALDGARIGFVASLRGTNRTTTRLFDQAVAKLQSLGATVVPVTPPAGFTAVLNEASGSTNEFKHDLDEYIARHLAPPVPFRSLLEIANSGRIVPSRRNTYISRNNITPAQYEAWAGPAGSHTLALKAGKEVVTAMLDADDLDALIYPSTNPYATQGNNLRVSPNTGMPAVTVPMGQAIAADTTITGAGVNLEFLGRDFDEGPLLGLAYAYEQATKWRTTPALFPGLAAGAPLVAALVDGDRAHVHRRRLRTHGESGRYGRGDGRGLGPVESLCVRARPRVRFEGVRLCEKRGRRYDRYHRCRQDARLRPHGPHQARHLTRCERRRGGRDPHPQCHTDGQDDCRREVTDVRRHDPGDHDNAGHWLRGDHGDEKDGVMTTCGCR